MAAITWTGVAAAAGGVGFAGFWLGSLFKVEVVPWPVALLWHALVTVLLAFGAARSQVVTDGSRMRRTLGWFAVALIVVGQFVSLELTMLGFLFFGVALTAAPRLPPRSAGALLATGAVVFLVTQGFNGPFWGDPYPTPPMVPTVSFGIALLLIAFGWIVLAVSPPVADTASGSSGVLET